jgi:hypothetical protein
MLSMSLGFLHLNENKEKLLKKQNCFASPPSIMCLISMSWILGKRLEKLEEYTYLWKVSCGGQDKVTYNSKASH